MSSTILLNHDIRRQIDKLAEAGYPNETCGLLLGRTDRGRCTVLAQRAARNINQERARDRFEIHPADYLAAEEAAAAEGTALVGVWHSHPDHPAIPSATDLASAWPGWSYVIVAVDAGKAVDFRSWRLAGGEFREEEIRDE